MSDSSIDSETPDSPAPDPLRSVHTTSFPELLDQIGASVLVTTYQAGKLVVLHNDGGVLNTHFRNLVKPMGLAVDGGRLCVGCSIDVWEFHNTYRPCARSSTSRTATRLDRDIPRRNTSGPFASAGIACRIRRTFAGLAFGRY